MNLLKQFEYHGGSDYHAMVMRGGRVLRRVAFVSLAKGDVFKLYDRDDRVLLADVYVDGVLRREERWLKAMDDARPVYGGRYAVSTEPMPAGFQPDLDTPQAPIPSWVGPFLNRRATVEQEMFNAARKGQPVPPEQLRAWALRLGTPEEAADTDAILREALARHGHCNVDTVVAAIERAGLLVVQATNVNCGAENASLDR